jgi:transglutaminase superfamily protein
VRRLSEIRTPTDALLVAQFFVVAALIPGLMRFPLKRVKDLLEPSGALPEPDGARERHVLALVSLVLDFGRLVFRPTCLTRGITRYYALRRAGVDVALAFGIGQPTGGKVDGHCWLVKDGQPFLEAQDPRDTFTEMYRVSGGSTGVVALAC